MNGYLILICVLLKSGIFTSVLAFCEVKPKAKVILHSLNCHYKYSTSISKIEVFKDGEFLYAVEPYGTKGYEVVLDNLEKGTYNFRYSNIFYQKIEETLVIKDDVTYSLNLCIERFGERNISFKGLIDSITVSTPLIIEDEFYGCFRNQKSRLTVYLKHEKYYATLVRYQDKYDKSRGFKKFTVSLSADKIKRIREFEEELPYATEPAPSEMIFPNQGDNLTLELGAARRKLTWSTTNWVGYYELIEYVFDNKKIWD